MKTIPKIVLTGGPCAGKTTALAYLSEQLSNAGFHPIIVPEAATLLVGNGMSPNKFLLPDFQREIMSTVFMLEDQMMRVAQTIDHPKPILICDRGIMDSKAYVPPRLFDELLEERGLSVVDVRDRRYDTVYHLRSAAWGAEEFYSTANNKTRLESVDEARRLDDVTLRAWTGHSKVVILENNRNGVPISFNQKLRRLVKAVFKNLGLPEPLEIERKFLVRRVDPLLVPSGQTVRISQFYLMPEDGYDETRFRKRTQDGSSIYFETKKRSVRPGVRVETERSASEMEYEFAKRFKLPGSVILEKDRKCFVYDNRYFELDTFIAPFTGMQLLELELEGEHDVYKSVPPGFDVVEDVTDNKDYSNRVLAHA